MMSRFYQFADVYKRIEFCFYVAVFTNAICEGTGCVARVDYKTAHDRDFIRSCAIECYGKELPPSVGKAGDGRQQ
ncbi:MAG: hypothetical protein J6T35_08805 [Bacteroidales bacterium]|nr:hypothetical protein [Bacteroidales bacterium]